MTQETHPPIAGRSPRTPHGSGFPTERDLTAYRDLFRRAPVAITLLSLDGRVLDSNAAALALTGHRRDEVVGRRLVELPMLFPEDASDLKRAYTLAVGGSVPPSGEARLRHADGSTRHVVADIVPLERGGRPYALHLICRDVTGAKAAEGDRVRGDALAEALMGSFEAGILISGRDERIEMANDAACVLLGLEREHLVGQRLRSFLRGALDGTPDSNGRPPYLVAANGTAVPAALTARAVGDGRIVWKACTRRERDLAERKRRESERRLQTLVDGAPVVLYAFDREGVFTLSEGKALARLGLRPGEVVGTSAFDLYADQPEVCHALRRVLAGESIEGEFVVGDRNWDVRYSPLYDSLGAVVGGIGVATDLTERRRAERALAESEARYRALVEHGAVGIWHVTAEGHTIYANPPMLALLEVQSMEELSGSSYHSFFPNTSLDVIRREQQKREGGTRSTYEIELLTAKGRERTVLVSGAPILASDGTVASLIGTFADVTDRHEAEAERRRLVQRDAEARRHESLGILAGGIAHDYNNLLTAVLGNADLAAMRLPADSPVQKLLGRIEGAAQRAADLTNQILAYSGKGRLRRQPVRFGCLVDELREDLIDLGGDHLAWRFELAPDDPPFLADADQMRRVIRNLVDNAAEAARPAGTCVVVRTGTTSLPADFVDPEWSAGERTATRFALLEVRDDGHGMDPGTRQHAFEPFYSTREAGRGLGLAAVRGIIRGHHGGVHLESRIGGGTIIRVLLPCDECDPGEDGCENGQARGNGQASTESHDAGV